MAVTSSGRVLWARFRRSKTHCSTSAHRANGKRSSSGEGASMRLASPRTARGVCGHTRLVGLRWRGLGYRGGVKGGAQIWGNNLLKTQSGAHGHAVPVRPQQPGWLRAPGLLHAFCGARATQGRWRVLRLALTENRLALFDDHVLVMWIPEQKDVVASNRVE